MAEPTSSRPAGDETAPPPPTDAAVPDGTVATPVAPEDAAPTTAVFSDATQPLAGVAPRRVAAVPIVVDATSMDAAGPTQPVAVPAAPEPEPAAVTEPAVAPRLVAEPAPPMESATSTGPVVADGPVASAPSASTASVPTAPVAPEPVAANPAVVDVDADDERTDPPAWTSPPPTDRGNRTFGVFVALAAAGIFEVLYLVVLAILVAIISGAAAVPASMGSFFTDQIAWLPVAVFFVFFLLLVLLFNRAGRFAYVIGSLIVGGIVYAGTVGVLLLIGLTELQAQPGAVGVAAGQLFASPVTIAAGFVAREVMLWTGMGIGARGKRVKDRNRAARAEYDAAFDPAT